MRPRHVSLFTGIGGIDLAADWAGFETVAMCERDAYCRRVLAKHWPNVPVWSDVHEFSAQSLRDRGITGRIDLISGGFPCQPFSDAGKKLGTADERHLWPEMLRVVSEIRPTWVLGENVAGFVSMALDDVCADLECEGYEVAPFLIPASGVGARHHRKRCFIVAYAAGAGLPHGRGASVGERRAQPQPQRRNSAQRGLQDVAYATEQGSLPTGETGRGLWPDAQKCGADDADTDSAGPQGHGGLRECASEWTAWKGRLPFQAWWLTQSELGGGADGFPDWLHGHCGRGMSHAESYRAVEALRDVWSDDVSAALWQRARGLGRIQQAEILFAFVREYQARTHEARLLVASAQVSQVNMRGVRRDSEATGASHQPRHHEQRSIEHSDAMQVVSRLLAHDPEEAWMADSWEDGIPRIATGISKRVNRLRALGNAVVPQQVYPILCAIYEQITGER